MLMQSREKGMDHLHYSRDKNRDMDLREYLTVIGKRKNILIAVLLGSSLIGVLWGFIATKYYEVSMVIEPPGSMDEGIQNYDTVQNVKAKIESGAFNGKIFKALGISSMPRLIVTQPRDTRLIRVSMERPEGGTELGINILNKLMDELRTNYSELLEYKFMRADNQVKAINIQIHTKLAAVKLQIDQLALLEDRERLLMEELKETKRSTDKLLATSDFISEKGTNKDGVAALLYTVTIQQNMTFFHQIQSELSDIKKMKENMRAAIETSKSDIDQTRAGIENVMRAKGAIKNIVMIQEPLVAPHPNGPEKKELILFFAIIGLVAGTFCALFYEYWMSPRPLVVLENQPI